MSSEDGKPENHQHRIRSLRRAQLSRACRHYGTRSSELQRTADPLRTRARVLQRYLAGEYTDGNLLGGHTDDLRRFHAVYPESCSNDRSSDNRYLHNHRLKDFVLDSGGEAEWSDKPISSFQIRSDVIDRYRHGDLGFRVANCFTSGEGSRPTISTSRVGNYRRASGRILSSRNTVASSFG